MKRNKILSTAVFMLLWLPQLLFAQQEDSFSKMKPGDWFEVRVNDYNGYLYEMKYHLAKILDNGNRDYNLTFERIRIKLLSPGSLSLGYDSYYPAYLQSNNETLDKPGFQLQVNKVGKTISMKADKDFQPVLLNEITARKKSGGSSAEMSPVQLETAQTISETVTTAIGSHHSQLFNGGKLKDSDLSILLFGASFPLPKNTLLTGNISNFKNGTQQQLSLYSASNGGYFTIAEDGSFKIPLSIKEPIDVQLYDEGDLHISLFVKPGDTLTITADGNNIEESLRFLGKGARTAELGVQMGKIERKISAGTKEVDPKSFSTADFMTQQQKDKATFENVLNTYKGQIPEDAWNYYYFKFTFEQATKKLRFLSRTGNLSTPGSTEIFKDFPTDFFLSIDTLPILMIDQTSEGWYQRFLHDFDLYLGDKVGMVSGQFGFFASYPRSLTFLKRFPLYYSLSESLKQELVNSTWKQAQSLKAYYEDLIRNCGDSILTNPVKQNWKVISAWAPGKASPLTSLKLSDGKTLDLKQFKGKTLCLTFNFHYPDNIKHLIDRIKKQDPKKVHFVIAQIDQKEFPKGTIDSILKSLPNVTYVEVSRDDEQRDKAVLLDFWDVKTFIFDSDLKIVDDNIDDSYKPQNDHLFEDALKRAMITRQMSPEKKAALIRTIGWSACSIFVSFLVGLWIYKVRVANLKKKELMKRQIKELEIKAIRSQMNPHFLFNALNSIQSLINNQQYKEANVYLQKFALLMRRVLNNSEKSFVTLSDELEAVELYCELEKLRFDFTFSIDIRKEVNADLIEIPGMIIQPLVENSIVHGLAQKGTAGALKIKICLEQIYLKIEVTDNGLGLKKESADQSSNGFGLKLVRERLNLLNARGAKGNLILSSNLEGDESGTSAVLTIPID
ncbi:histidine kinase [Pedobacter sp. B4-66]|uniref:sensor histidine kinase n=1 Tax=Pedobacter sp. B4-66 TaxID=2817280 RepID=UPI001BD94954|nr:histidine kinase [Pedobacter sp. B4-66]